MLAVVRSDGCGGGWSRSVVALARGDPALRSRVSDRSVLELQRTLFVDDRCGSLIGFEEAVGREMLVTDEVNRVFRDLQERESAKKKENSE